MNKKKILLPILAAFALTACNPSAGGNSSTGTPDSSYTSETSSSSEETSSSATGTLAPSSNLSATEAFETLQDNRARYTLSVGANLTSPDAFDVDDPTQTYVFTPNYYTKKAMANKDEITDTGYLVENGGVSSYTYNTKRDNLVRSELMEDASGNLVTDLEDASPSFRNVSLTGSTETDGVLDLSKKTIALQLFKIFEIDDSEYFYLDSLTLSLSGVKSQDDMTFTFKFTKANSKTSVYYYVGVISLFGSAESSYLESFLEDPLPAFSPSDNAKRVRSLFALDNYTQYRDLTGTQPESFDQFDYFTKQYYFIEFTEEYKASSSDAAVVAATYGDRGYLSIEDKTMNYDGTDLVFNGCYLFFKIDGEFSIFTREDPNSPGTAQSSFTQDYTDITYVMNYPGNMTCVNEFQLATEDEEGKIHFTDSEVMANFVTNFNLSESLSSYGVSAYELVITPEIATEDKDCVVTFQLYVNEENYFEYVFKDFGNTAVDFIEDYISENNLASD